MTTAHRPTFHPARGGTGRAEGDLSKLSQQYSSKDMPSHLKMKYRQTGQGTKDELRSRDLRRELEEKEREAVREKRSRDIGARDVKRAKIEEAPTSVDADEPIDEVSSLVWNCSDLQPDSSDESSDEDDTQALMEELARIKKERAAEKAEKEAVEKEEEERIRTENILHGNPLLSLAPGGGSSSDFKVKRRWDDDVVFKNCAKGLDERKKEPTFINDAIRSDFHRKFMDKYIK